MGSFPYPRNGMVKVNYEHILLFKKPGQAPRPSPEAKEKSKLTIEEWNAYFSGIWTIPGIRQTGHVAMFPLEIPSRLIRMYSFWGETVLDPFAGSGTTMGAAAELGRNSVGVEIDESNVELVCERLNGLLQVSRNLNQPK
jgi:site-specific DNA-methyltransferase (adenine-specific)